MAIKTDSATYHKTLNQLRKVSIGTTLQDRCNDLTLQQLHAIAGRTQSSQ